jgi:hypothetical protein
MSLLIWWSCDYCNKTYRKCSTGEVNKLSAEIEKGIEKG